jgi:hypothetical protein
MIFYIFNFVFCFKQGRQCGEFWAFLLGSFCTLHAHWVLRSEQQRGDRDFRRWESKSIIEFDSGVWLYFLTIFLEQIMVMCQLVIMHPCLTTVWMKLCDLILNRIEFSKQPAVAYAAHMAEIIAGCFAMTREIIRSAAANRKSIGLRRTTAENEWVFLVWEGNWREIKLVMLIKMIFFLFELDWKQSEVDRIDGHWYEWSRRNSSKDNSKRECIA